MVRLAEVRSYGNSIVVWLKTELGYFSGEARCHPDDQKHYSEIFGGRLAETRAWKRYCKARMKEVKETGTILSKFMENCIHYKNFDTRYLISNVHTQNGGESCTTTLILLYNVELEGIE